MLGVEVEGRKIHKILIAIFLGEAVADIKGIMEKALFFTSKVIYLELEALLCREEMDLTEGQVLRSLIKIKNCLPEYLQEAEREQEAQAEDLLFAIRQELFLAIQWQAVLEESAAQGQTQEITDRPEVQGR